MPKTRTKWGILIIAAILPIHSVGAAVKPIKNYRFVQISKGKKARYAFRFNESASFNIQIHPRKVFLKKTDIEWRFRNRNYPHVAPLPVIAVPCKNRQSAIKATIRTSMRIKNSSFFTKNPDLIKVLSNRRCRLTVTPQVYGMLKGSMLASRLTNKSYDLLIDVASMTDIQKNMFVDHFSNLNSKKFIHDAIHYFLAKGRHVVPLSDLVMPPFFQSRAHSFPMYRGVNSVFASLSFVDFGIERWQQKTRVLDDRFSTYYLDGEDLTKTIKAGYQLVIPSQPLKFGDVFVFSTKRPGALTKFVNARSVYHTANYISHGYFFTKYGLSVNESFRLQSWGDMLKYLFKRHPTLYISVYRRDVTRNL